MTDPAPPYGRTNFPAECTFHRNDRITDTALFNCVVFSCCSSVARARAQGVTNNGGPNRLSPLTLGQRQGDGIEVGFPRSDLSFVPCNGLAINRVFLLGSCAAFLLGTDYTRDVMGDYLCILGAI